MPSIPRRTLLLVVLALVAAAAGAALSVHSARSGEILIDEHRAVAGPIRLLGAPWNRPLVLPAALPISLQLPLELGEGSRWPLQIDATLQLSADQLGDEARRFLRDGAAAKLSAQISAQLASLREKLSLRDLLAHPARLAETLRGPIKAQLPAGVSLAKWQVAVVASPEQVRALAQTQLPSATTAPTARVLYIGLDGADWELILPLVQAGRLPTFGRLLREGVRAELQSYEPMISPLLWTTALTGRDPDEHGICDFTLEKPDGTKLPISSRSRKVPAIWEILAAQQQPSAFVYFWATHPAEQNAGSAIVSDIVRALISQKMATPPLPAGATYPPDLLDPLWPKFLNAASIPTSQLRPLAPPLSDADWDQARLYWTDDARRQQWNQQREKGRRQPPDSYLVTMAADLLNIETQTKSLLANPKFGTIGVYFEAIDLAGHFYQHLAPPAHPLAPEDERRKFAGTVEAVYALQDEVLGRIVDTAGPDTIVIAHSDHGFAWGNRRPTNVVPFTEGQPVEWHRPTGIFLAWGPGVRRGVAVPPVTLYEITPTLLALRGLPPSEAMPGEVRRDLFEPSVAAKLPAQRIPSWDLLVPPRHFGGASDAELEEAQAQLLDTLRGLGYVDDAPASRPAHTPATTAEGAEARPAATYYRNLATWYLNQDRFEDAETVLRQANELTPLPKTYWLISESRAARGDLDGAIAALKEGFQKLPQDVSATNVLWLLQLQLRQKDLAGAEATLAARRTLVEREPSSLALAEGLLAEARGDEPLARSRYLAALDHDPREARAAERYAALAKTAEERAALLPHIQAGLAADQRIETYWQMLGLLLAEKQDARGSWAAFQRALELDPRSSVLRMNAAAAAARVGELAAAEALLTSLARDGVKIPAVYVNLGSLRAGHRDWTGAAAAWRQAIALGADTPQLRQALADVERRAGSSR